MTDRELLELAAKACGFELLDCTCKKERKNSVTGKHWNPLTADGDALRLAVQLRMRIATPTSDTDCAIAGMGDMRGVHVKAYSEYEITDPYAATRRAIVRAAASIGGER